MAPGRPAIWHDHEAEIRRRWNAGEKARAIAAALAPYGIRIGMIYRAIMDMNLHRAPGHGRVLAPKNPALAQARTVYPKSRRHVSDVLTVLKPGRDAVKLGTRVEKGAWRGMPIFSLTLEERATCPKTCAQWAWCYGNAMPFAARMEAGAALEWRLEGELAHRQRRSPAGFVVRLHQLGDFYSVHYVGCWQVWLRQFPALHVFGYTAWDDDSLIGIKLRKLARTEPRFRLRFSGTVAAPLAAIVVDADPHVDDVIVCPAQTGATRNCGTCALCWAPAASIKTIAFLRHGMTGRPQERHG